MKQKLPVLIGAVRNNTIGVAGMAGGNFDSDQPNGVRMYVYKIGSLVAAWSDAVMDDNVHVINYSGGNSSLSLLLREQMHFANRMEVIQVGSRGNSDDGPGPHYPCSMQDEWIICVGGTGVDGFYNPECLTGSDVDIAAPSRWQLVRTIDLSQPSTYGGMSFTSAAAPHAAALGALIQGYYTSTNPNLHLVQEDIEYVIQETADDVYQDPAIPGPDDYTGHGKINAGAAMQLIERPGCSILHYGTDSDQHTRTSQMLEENITIELTEAFTTESGLAFSAGTYKADVYKINATVNHSLPSGLNILTDHWERHSNSTVFKYYDDSQNELQPLEFVTLTSTPTNSSADLEGYVYLLKDNSCNEIGWIPASPDDAELTYSLIACMMTGTSEQVVEKGIKIYPNPTKEIITVELAAYLNNKVTVEIIDAQGKQFIKEEVFLSSGDKNGFKINCQQLPDGIYFCKVISDQTILSKKFLKF